MNSYSYTYELIKYEAVLKTAGYRLKHHVTMTGTILHNESFYLLIF